MGKYIEFTAYSHAPIRRTLEELDYFTAIIDIDEIYTINTPLVHRCGNNKEGLGIVRLKNGAKYLVTEGTIQGIKHQMETLHRDIENVTPLKELIELENTTFDNVKKTPHKSVGNNTVEPLSESTFEENEEN